MKYLLVSFIPTLAFAHIDVGTWSGVKADGTPCQMIVGEGFFENKMPHPLNERISVTIDGNEFTVRHPASVVSSDSAVTFNHDFFHGIIAHKNGALGLEIEMEHSQKFEGPKAFTFINHNWRTGEKTSFKCNTLSK